MDSKQYQNSGTIGGVILIALGIIFFAATQGLYNLSWGSIWPAFVMLGGVVILARAFTATNPAARSAMVLGGTIPLLLGAFFFATTMGLVSWSDQGKLWPIYPLIVGVAFSAAYFASNREVTAYLIPGGILTAVAVVFLAITLSDASYGIIAKLWPLGLIIGGVMLLVLPRMQKTRNS